VECMSDSQSAVEWESDRVEILYEVAPINSGYRYRLFEVDGEEVLFARRWEVYDHDVGGHRPREGDEWEVTRDDEAIEEFVER